MTALDVELRASTSATAVLQKRCSTPISAEVDRGVQSEARYDVRAALGVGVDVNLYYRLVKLKCGNIIFSRAHNWYRPDHLTVEMNAALLSSDIPFGVAIKPLQPTRKTMASERIVESGAILRHRTMVLFGVGQPLAFVIEAYAQEVLFAMPQ